MSATTARTDPDTHNVPSQGCVPDVSKSSGNIPCVYCRKPIAAHAFSYWSTAKRLVSAGCPACHRRVTLTSATWRRWSITSAIVDAR